MLEGAMTALVTPLDDEGKVDFGRLEANVQFQIEHGIDALVPVGTTGESPTLSHAEHREVISAVVRAADGRVRVIAGTGSNATSEAMELTAHAADAGADAALMVNPYYNKPSQEGLLRHFSAIADAVDLPIVLYNIPGRTGITMAPTTVAQLAKHQRIIGIKEATGSLDIASEIAMLTDPASFSIVSGDDSLTLPIMSVGGRGVISVLSNLIPGQVKALVDAAASCDIADARRRHHELFSLCRALLSLDTNPIPIKAAMALVGMDSGKLRLPMTELASDKRDQLAVILRNAGITPVAIA